MITIRMVELPNKKYAVQVQERRFGWWEFCESKWPGGAPKYGRDWGSGECVDLIQKYCVVDTQEEAEVAFTKTLEHFKNDPPSSIKVVRVIKSVSLK